MVDEFVNVLLRQLPKYGRIKIPSISEDQAKKIIAMLIAKGIRAKFEDGYLVLVDEKPDEKPQKTDQQVEQQTGQGNKQEDDQEAVKLLTVRRSTRVCLRIRQDMLDAIQSIYHDPNTSSAIRKALLELLKLKGYEISTYDEEDQPIDVDKLLEEMSDDKERK
jgi:hypothetical protein